MTDWRPQVGDVVGNDPQGVGTCPKCEEFVVYGCWHRCLDGLVMVLRPPLGIDGQGATDG